MYRSKASHGGRRTTGRSEGLFCNYSHRICMQDRHEGFEYCLDHILEDKSAPFKQCNFVSTKTGQKCQKAAPKADRKEGYCPAHARKAAQMRHKAALKAKPTDAVKDTLDELDYYRPTSSKSVPETPPSLATKILDYGSESESDGDPLLLDQAWRGTTDSDAESVDSEQEDSLKYAGVYTAEEAALITRDKLIRLQSLYINQFKRLQHLMREKRRQYLIAQQQERETYGIDFGVITDPKQKRKFREYQAARGFRRRKGKEALLYQKSKRRRIEATPDYQGKQKVPLMLQCCYTCPTKEKGQCSKFSLPMAKFCKDHILMDPKQVLYVECTKGNGHCDRPASLMAPDESCSLHMGLPEHVPYKPYEPEPPPPPPPPPVPKQVPVPQPPPTIIPIPEQALPPAPILPSQLDSQIDQLLQFQPHFLEQQLQQHVYDTSQLLSSFAQPDMDIQVDSQGDVQADTNVAGASQATQMTTADSEGSNRLDIDKSGLPTNEGTAQYSIQVDAQTDIHVDVETDLPSDGQPEVEESVQTGQQVSATWTSPSASVDQKDTEHTDSSENANVGAQERGSEAVDMAEDVPMQTEQSLPSDKAEEPTQGQTETGTDLKQEVEMTDQHISQADVTENTPEATDMTVPPVTEASQIVEDTVISSTTVTVDEQSACHATGDHNYNQQPSLVSPEPSEQIIDVTGIPDESASNQDLDLETGQSSDQRECSAQDQTTPGSEDLLSNSGTGN